MMLNSKKKSGIGHLYERQKQGHQSNLVTKDNKGINTNQLKKGFFFLEGLLILKSSFTTENQGPQLATQCSYKGMHSKHENTINNNKEYKCKKW